ncbi:hypothetical protein D7X74_41655, partial [Corallococcus sp. CA047B]|uniref:hypothetical protein n=1 Tax=Corallococcus sp. CA047B TaxID=2316729 RepID=UPI000EE25FC9
GLWGTRFTAHARVYPLGVARSFFLQGGLTYHQGREADSEGDSLSVRVTRDAARTANATLGYRADLGTRGWLAFEAGWAFLVQGVEFASLVSAPAPPVSRGMQDQLRQLFATPFGPQALAAFEQTRKAGLEPVYGISLADRERMRQVVETFSAVAQDRDRAELILFSATVVSSLGSSAILLSQDGTDARLQGFGTLGVSLLFGSLDLLQQLRREDPALLLEEFNASDADPAADPGRTIARVDYRLNRFLAQERKIRRQLATAGWLYVGASVVMFGLAELLRVTDSDPQVVVDGERAALLMAVSGTSYLLRAHYTQSATEHLVRQWNSDPELRRLPRVSVAPVRGGAMLAVGAAF